MISKISKWPTSEEKWNVLAEVQRECKGYVYKLTKNKKMWDTEYRIYNRFYHTERQLYIWKKKESDNCKKCKVIDTIEHHFVNCIRVKKLWTMLGKWKTEILRVTFNETIEEKLIGIQNIDSNSIIDVINFLNICLKTYIRENEENELYFHVFIEYVKQQCKSSKMEKIEMAIVENT